MLLPNSNHNGSFESPVWISSVSNPALMLPAPNGSTTTMPVLSPGEGTEAPSTPDAGTIVRAFQRRWLLVLTLGLVVGAIAAAAGWFFIPIKYTATTLLRVEANRPIMLQSTQEDRAFNFTNYQ